MTGAERDLLATAYHEAGHAVIAFHEGISLTSASIIKSDGWDGMVHYENPFGRSNFETTRSDANRLKAERYARATLAGYFAQRKFDRRTVRSWHAHSDRHKAADIMEYFVASDLELNAWLRLLEIQAKQILEIRWPDVRALAMQLMERKKMNGRQIRACLNQSR